MASYKFEKVSQIHRLYVFFQKRGESERIDTTGFIQGFQITERTPDIRKKECNLFCKYGDNGKQNNKEEKENA